MTLDYRLAVRVMVGAPEDATDFELGLYFAEYLLAEGIAFPVAHYLSRTAALEEESKEPTPFAARLSGF